MTRAPQPPWPLIEIAVEPKSKGDQLRLENALAELRRDDPGFDVRVDAESGQIILGGLDESDLDGRIATLRETHALDLRIGRPQVAYRETTTRRVEVDVTHKRVLGSTGEFARVKLVVEPLERGAGVRIESKVVDGSFPRDYVAGFEMGIATVLRGGLLAGFPVVDIAVVLIDGAYHDVDSSAHTFELAGRAALREALQKGGSIILEPVMAVEVVCPEAFVGSVTDDLRSRRGHIGARSSRANLAVVDAEVPLANMFGYANALRLFTLGQGSFTSRFLRYETQPSADDDPTLPPAAAAALRA